MTTKMGFIEEVVEWTPEQRRKFIAFCKERRMRYDRNAVYMPTSSKIDKK